MGLLSRRAERHGCSGMAAVGWGKPPAAPIPGPLQPPGPSQPTRFPSSLVQSWCGLLLLGDCLPDHTIPPACDTAREASPSPFKYKSRESVRWPRCFQQESWPTLGALLRQLCNPSFFPKACLQENTSLELQRQVIDHLGGKMGWFNSIFHHC